MGSFILSAFADEISDDLQTQCLVLRRQGIGCLELRSIEGTNIAQMELDAARGYMRTLTAQGISVSALGSPIGKTPIEAPFCEVERSFRHVCALAHIFSTQYIRMFSFYMPRAGESSAWRDEVLSRLSRLIDIARAEGLVLLHENEKDIYGDIPERCADIMWALFCENFAMTYDPSNFVQCGARNYPDAYMLLRPYIRYVHIKDSLYAASAQRDRGFDTSVVSDAHRPAGEGDGCLVEILSALDSSGYEGYLSIEPHLSSYTLSGSTPEDRFAVAAYALRKIISSLGRQEA